MIQEIKDASRAVRLKINLQNIKANQISQITSRICYTWMAVTSAAIRLFLKIENRKTTFVISTMTITESSANRPWACQREIEIAILAVALRGR